MFAARPRHRERPASEVLALAFGFALDFEALLLRQKCVGRVDMKALLNLLLPASRPALVDPHNRRRRHVPYSLAFVVEKRIELGNQRPPQGIEGPSIAAGPETSHRIEQLSGGMRGGLFHVPAGKDRVEIVGGYPAAHHHVFHRGDVSGQAGWELARGSAGAREMLARQGLEAARIAGSK
jgi:hypothetical protein